MQDKNIVGRGAGLFHIGDPSVRQCVRGKCLTMFTLEPLAGEG